MKVLTLLLIASLQASVLAFTFVSDPSRHRPTVTTTTTTTTTTLHLFGSGGKDGEKKGPGVMDKLAMLKTAQEMQQKKQKIDDELKKMTFEGVSENGKVKGIFKYSPSIIPLENPECEPVSFEFDDEFYNAATPEELSTATKSAYGNGVETVYAAIKERYAVWQQDLMEAMSAMQGKK